MYRVEPRTEKKMSKEEETKEKTEETSERDKPKSIADEHVGLIVAERDSLKIQLEEEKALNENLTKQLADVNAILEQKSKAALINRIAPRTSVPKDVLAMMDYEKLVEWDKILGYAKSPAFKAGTPMVSVDKSPQAKLANMYHDYKAKTWGRNR